MPRRSSRAVPASTTKRRAPDRFPAEQTDAKKPRHAPGSVRTTARRSQYFEQQGEDSDKDPQSGVEDESEVQEGAESAAEAEETKVATASPSLRSKRSSAAGGSDGGGRAQEEQKKKKSQGGIGKGKKQATGSGSKHDDNDDNEATDLEDGGAAPASLKDKELWREGVRTGLGPGKEVFIPKPKARDPGKVAYQDHTLHPNTMLFLQDLKENNDREWLKAHDPDFRAAKKDWETFVESLSEKIAEKDNTIPELPAKDLVFRIHRDIRFSKDPTPYKLVAPLTDEQAHFSAAWSRTGKKGPYAAYYVHMQPGSCFVGSGLWHPEADKLALLREDIDHDSSQLKTVLREPAMRREVFKGIPDTDEKTVKAFVDQNKESALKVKPKGYDVDNDNIQLLRLRSFTIGTPFSDSDLLGAEVQERIAALVGIMEPFVTYLNGVVMPDPVRLDSPSGSESANESE